MENKSIARILACSFFSIFTVASSATAGSGQERRIAPAYDVSVPEPTLSAVRYGEHDRQVLDFWKAKSERPTPLVFVIHGGGWRAGSKERLHRFVDTSDLLEAGISVVAINYRLIKYAKDINPPIKAPLHDAARALQFVRSKAAEWNIDKYRIGAAGGSAGGCSSLWLAHHDDLADPTSEDPIARESTRLWCAAVTNAQTTLDPQQMKAWTPNSHYGAFAFGKKDFAEFLAERNRIERWISEYSPYALVSSDDPPVYLMYESPPAIGKSQKDPTHTSNFGVKLMERCTEIGTECELVYPGAANVTHATPTEYLIAQMRRPVSILSGQSNMTDLNTETPFAPVAEQAFAQSAIHLIPGERPNVLIIYGDDVGYGDAGVYGAEKIPTPNIDQLAAEGLRFTDGHATAATCTPSRYSMLTGMYAFRKGLTILPPEAPLVVPTDKLTLPKLFKKAGYKTGVVGKWHLGLGNKGTPVDWNGAVKPGPLEVGFDYSYLLPVTNDRVPCVYLEGHHVVNLDPSDPLYVTNTPNPPEGFSGTVYPIGRKNVAAQTYYRADNQHASSVINGIARIGYQWGGKSALWDDETMADHFVEKAKAFIADHEDEPFFLYFASQDIHVPRAPHPRFQGVTELGMRGDAMVQFDWTTGELMKALEENGLTENTIVILSSDNGPVYNDGYWDGSTVMKSKAEVDNGHDGSGIYSGGKYQILEGGTRVPFIVRWPTRISPGVSDALVSQIDFIASFASLLDLELAHDEAPDSRDSLAAFMGDDPVGLPFMPSEASKAIALRRGEWKYIEFGVKDWAYPGMDGQRKLFNLAEDLAEKNNVLSKHPEVASEMKTMLDQIKAKGRIRE